MGSCVDEVVCVCVCDLITEYMGVHIASSSSRTHVYVSVTCTCKLMWNSCKELYYYSLTRVD